MGKKELKNARLRARREKTSLSIRYAVYGVLRYLFLGFIIASVLNVVFTYAFNTPKVNNIWRSNAALVEKYQILDDKIRSLDRTLDELKHRDNAVYRSLFGADTLTIEGVYREYPDSKYAGFSDDRFAPMMLSTWHSLDAVARRLYLQSVSLDQLQDLASDKEQMASAMPALMPIDPADLRGNIGAFRMNRLHPVLGYVRPHWGVDLGGQRGDPIYATGDGFVRSTGWNGGYGNNIIVDHGFGYRTRYAHLSKISVTRGQFVKRGEQIGEMGSTGLSSGNHLHYEVIYRGVRVNPINYFQPGMDPAEFEKIIQKVNDDTIYEIGAGTNAEE